MPRDEVDVVIVGAGVIGLAIAAELARPGRMVVLLERHDGFGRETSSRNSEVIHAGLYYGEDLLKTTLCLRGNPLLYELCARVGIPHRRCGKIVVATDRSEEVKLEAIHAQATRNGVRGIRWLDRPRLVQMESRVSGTMGLYSPDSGIVDSHALMAWLERDAVTRGVTLGYGCDVTAIAWTGRGYRIEARERGGERTLLSASVVINAAGLGADRIAAMAGIDTAKAGYRIRPCKGEYFRIAARHRSVLSHLVYPTPTPYHLGAHAVLGLDDSLKLGPSSFYVETIDYDVDPEHAQMFHEKAHRFLPFLEVQDLTPDQAGIRPKLYGPGEPLRDFVIREESDRALPGLVDLVGMESPGLTACLAIAEMVRRLI